MRNWGLLGLAILLAVAAGVAIFTDIPRRAMEMRPADTRAAAVLNAKPGTTLRAVVRLEDGEGANTYRAELLESAGDGTTYRDTPNRIEIALSPAASFVMGSPRDIKSGAIIEASGAIDGTHRLHVNRIVVLNGFVRMAPG
jgi:hypothetical protein